MPVTITTPLQLDGPQRAAVLELAQSIEAADGAPPLSDQSRSQLGSESVHHFVASSNDELIGYAQLTRSVGEHADIDQAEVVGAENALDPLLTALEATSQAVSHELELWAHGRLSRLVPVLEHRTYDQVRVLWQLRWPVTKLAAVPVAPGITVRPFEIGRDETAWLAVNAAAFAHHPEQGGWTQRDLQAREAEPWFDPAGFLLAERANSDGTAELLGFHWTKRHSPSIGEVYVIGVAPAAQGLQLGKALLVAGLEHLRRVGVTEVLLYVDESNLPAMALYERYGFQRHDNDAQYRLRPAH